VRLCSRVTETIATVATELVSARHPLTSIVILTYNQLEYTRQCVRSVLDHTSEPFELIFVDNASSDGTVDYLQTIPGAKLIRNAENLGFAGGNNQGLALAEGEYVVLLNNDTVVPAGWLDSLLAPMQRDQGIGFTGPRSNYVAGPQIVPDVPYTSIKEMHRYAARRRQAHRDQGTVVGFIVGFCLAVRKTVVDKIGGLDTQYGSGNFEDNDFCLRAVLGGWVGWIADDAFVHHYGHKTFIGAGIDWTASMRTNAKLFARKWDLPLDGDAIAPYQVGEIAQHRGFKPDEDRFPLPASVDFVLLTPGLAAYFRGVQLLQQGSPTEAIQKLRFASEQSPEVADFHNTLGAAYFEAGKREDAIAALSRAAELSPNDASIADNLAAALQTPVLATAPALRAPARNKTARSNQKHRR
jgi:GT2 family glycosyltransferase